MSVDFNAIMQCQRQVSSPEEWVPLFAALDGRLEAAIARWQKWWSVDRWQLHPPLSSDEYPNILGPGGFAISISPVAANVYHCSRFSILKIDSEHRRVIRNACFDFAQLLGSPRAIYMPELTPNVFHEDASLDEIEADLHRNFGEPAASMSTIADSYQPHSYFVDGFDDLRGATPT